MGRRASTGRGICVATKKRLRNAGLNSIRKLWRMSKFKQASLRRNVVTVPTHLTLTGNEFHIVGAPTEETLVPTFILALGTQID